MWSRFFHSKPQPDRNEKRNFSRKRPAVQTHFLWSLQRTKVGEIRRPSTRAHALETSQMSSTKLEALFKLQSLTWFGDGYLLFPTTDFSDSLEIRCWKVCPWFAPVIF